MTSAADQHRLRGIVLARTDRASTYESTLDSLRYQRWKRMSAAEGVEMGYALVLHGISHDDYLDQLLTQENTPR